MRNSEPVFIAQSRIADKHVLEAIAILLSMVEEDLGGITYSEEIALETVRGWLKG